MVAIGAILCIAAAVGGGWVPASPADTTGHVKGGGEPRVEARSGLMPLRALDSGSWAALAARFSEDTLGTPWPEWVARKDVRDCESYRGGSALPLEYEFWVYRCREPAEVGHFEFESFLLGQDSIPTIERTRWCAGPASGLGRAQAEALGDSVGRSAAAALGGALRREGREILGGPRFGRWTLLAQCETPWGRLQVVRGEGDSLIVEHSSRRLEKALARAEDERWGEEDPARDSLKQTSARAEVAPAVRAATPRFAQALAVFPSRAEDAAAVASAAVAATRESPSPASDAVLWAAHLWLTSFRQMPADTASLMAAVRSYGGRYEPEPDDGWCLDDSLAERLALRPDADEWTREAFLELMERGWERRCALCGNEAPWGADQWKPVIDRGEEFLSRHPGSPIAREVRWLVAEAHETAWSLSRAVPGDEYIDWRDYVLAAPAHRERAIELYESLLPDEPQGSRPTAALRRLHRLKLDVDTGYHRFWCLWD